MTLRIRRQLLNEIRCHGEESFPDECCGFLIGTRTDAAKTVEDVRRTANEMATSRQTRFLISPEAYMDAEKHAQQKGWQVLGFYHSHPNHPARPSAHDLEQAWPWYSYLIVSVQEGRAEEVTSWVMKDDRTQFDPEALEEWQ